MKDIIPNEIPFDELYEDSAPHGRANIYFLAGMISYMAMYEENIPDTYSPSEIIHSSIRNDLELISDFVWEELNNFNFPNGESRVFYSTISSTNNNPFTIQNDLKIWPNHVNNYCKIYLSNNERYLMEIRGASGKLVHQSLFTDGMKEINTRNYPLGIYSIKLQNIATGKILINKFVKSN